MDSEVIPFSTSDISVEDYEEIRKKIMQQAVGVISNRFKTVFDENPEIQAVAWTQYTPYFNDGEACEFNVNELNLKLSKAERLRIGEEPEDKVKEFDINDIDEMDYWESDISYRNNSIEATRYRNIEKDLNNFAQNLAEIFKSGFGDHSKVVCTREGFMVEGYDHD